MAQSKNHPDVIEWLDKNPTGTFTQFKRINPKTRAYEKYFNNTKYSMNKRLKKSELDKKIAAERVTKLQIEKKDQPAKTPTKTTIQPKPANQEFDLGSELNRLIENVTGSKSKRLGLFEELISSASDTVIALSCNPRIDEALEMAEETLNFAGSVAIVYNLFAKSMSKIVQESDRMTKGEIVDAICLATGIKPKGSVIDTAQRLQEVSSRLLRVMNKKPKSD